MLTLDFLKMVVISIILAIPIGWYLMTTWLADFEYRTDITWDLFAIAGVIVVLIALFTVSFESIKASIVNPVKGLKSD
jgi:putative ABC transport system permease protein